MIEDLDLFEGASRATLEALAAAMVEEHVRAGDVVIREGDEPDDLFVATEGHLVVTAEGRGVVGELEAGDYFGEIGLLHRVKRTATVTAQTDCALVRMSGDTFLRLIAEGVAQSSSLVQNMQSRLAITRSGAARRPPRRRRSEGCSEAQSCASELQVPNSLGRPSREARRLTAARRGHAPPSPMWDLPRSAVPVLP